MNKSKTTEQDKRDIKQTNDILSKILDYLYELWEKEIRFDDCGNPIFEGLDDSDREIAEEKLMQLDAMETARLWLRRIETGELK